MQSLSREIISQGKSIGLVPTMGFLHKGHLSLIKRAKKSADIVITTIFVNPKQFAPYEDLENYPRDEKRDLKLIANAGGDIVFIPKVIRIYPEDFQTYIIVEDLTKILEGAARPTHFKGVTTIVAKLFNITRPDVAVFGMKDYQQALVLKRMTKDLGYPIKIIMAPTIRERSGLALSSRNKYFTNEQFKEAHCLYYALKTAKEMVKARIINCRRIEKEMNAVIRSICSSASVDYIAFTDFETIEPVKKIVKNTVCSLAVKVHNIRLIDNMKLL